jgi:hypothetical protein
MSTKTDTDDYWARVLAERAARPKGKAHRCDKCWYWTVHGGKDLHEDDRMGECHRHAPRAPPRHVGTALGLIAWSAEVAANVEHQPDFDYAHDEVEEYCDWPRTPAYQWCGDFLERMEEAK